MSEKPPFDFEALARSARLDLTDPEVAAAMTARTEALAAKMAEAQIEFLLEHLLAAKNKSDTMVNLAALAKLCLFLLDLYRDMGSKVLGPRGGDRLYFDLLTIALLGEPAAPARRPSRTAPKGNPHA